MENKTQQLRGQLIQAVQHTENNELLKAALDIINREKVKLTKAEREAIREADADIKAGRVISDEEFRKKHGI